MSTMKREPLWQRCSGKWKDILPAFKIDSSFLTGRHGPCPMCGGKDRFRFDNKRGAGTWICNNCGSGDGIELTKRITGLDFKEVASRIEAMLGTAQAEAVTAERDEQQCREAMKVLWESGKTLAEGDPVSLFLKARGLAEVGLPQALRYVDKAAYKDTDHTSYHPAMIARLVAHDGSHATSVHRTFLTADGQKASVTAPRRLMPGAVQRGSAVRLFSGGAVLGIAEGIETALAASILFKVPVWAALNAGLLAQWEPPAGVDTIIVFADNDYSFTGQKAAYTLANRLRAKNINVDVQLPKSNGDDWNDVLMREGV